MKRVVVIISNALCIFLIILLSIFEILKFANVIYVLQVQTGSMETDIHVGDYILVQNTNAYNTGDIITFKVQDYYVTHRVKSISGDKIITKGDANNTYDDQISSKDVIGKVVYKGKFLNFIFKYRSVLVIIAIAFFVLSCIFEDSADKDKEKKKKENKLVKDDDLEKRIENEVKVIDKELEKRRTKEVIENEVKVIDKELKDIERKEVIKKEVKQMDEELDKKDKEDKFIEDFKNELRDKIDEELNKSIKVIDDNNNNGEHKKKKKKHKKKKHHNNEEDFEII